ncbi:Cytidylate kinase [Ruminococcus sp. YE71]|uniref:cytidylate kinase-like family protein n=1 Tax=unclassified Ruminococcus TaxID=2608920 RepID=UPI000885D2EF|nr:MULTISPECIES: cytidylate kinase-like family protein [unclassified Ruminococcus]SDA23522.1 Cytidylate kinase [Ruminococcus sp. YE78]SFW39957.1 Cytidylate kinase [Ruminococcus sp. YE71]
MAKIRAIAIERQYCSGGREIAKLTAEKLGFEFYDKELMMLTAEKMGVEPEIIEKYEETLQNPFLSISFKGSSDRKKNMSETIFEVQADIITKLARKAPCVIVGRCADYILRNNVPTLSVFVYAPPETRVAHAMECHGIPYDDVAATLRKMDKKRAEYYKLNTRKEWDSKIGYDLCLNSSRLGLDGAAVMIANYVSSTF